MKRAKEMGHIEGCNYVQQLCERAPDELQQLHETLKAVISGHDMLLEASTSKLSGLNDMVCHLSQSSTAAELQLQEQENTILRLQRALECALADQRSMRRLTDDNHEYQEQAAKIVLLEDALAEAEAARDELHRTNAMVAIRDAEIEDLKRQLNRKEEELRDRTVQEETVTLVLDKFVQDNMRLQEQLLQAQEQSAGFASNISRRSSASSWSSVSSSIRFSSESSSRNSFGRRFSQGVDSNIIQPLLQEAESDLKNDEAIVIECKNLDTGCIELVSVANNRSPNSFGKRRRSSEASEENTVPNGQSSPGKMDFFDEAKQVVVKAKSAMRQIFSKKRVKSA